MMFGEFKKMNTNNSPAAGGGVGVGKYKNHSCLTAVRVGTAFF